LRLLGELGIQITIVINFTKAFAETSHEEFIENILVNRLRARYVFIGKNFRFGKGARGDCRFLRKMSHRYNFRLKVFEVMQLKGKPVSSTNIRRLITKGDLSGARKLLLRPVTILGTVIRGVTLGRRLGFPTANVNPHHEVLPPSGIYIVKIFLDNKPLVLPVLSPRRKHGEGFRSSKHTTHQGVCYIGTKPTIKERLSSGIKKSHEKFIEVHIFNFMKNIYGRDIEVQFIKKMRDDRKFESLPALIEQIKKDITYAKKYFSRH
jgi:riboflavin kinase/FMN adenylyltransferase